MIPTLNCYQCKIGSVVQVDIPCGEFSVNPFSGICSPAIDSSTFTSVKHFKFPGAQNTIYKVPTQILALFQGATIASSSFRSGFFSIDPTSISGQKIEVIAYSGAWHHYLLNTAPTPNNQPLYPMDYSGTIPIQGGSCVYVRLQVGVSQFWNKFGLPDCAAYPEVCAIRPPRESFQPPNAVPPSSTNNTIFTGQFMRISFDTSLTLPDP